MNSHRQWIYCITVALLACLTTACASQAVSSKPLEYSLAAINSAVEQSMTMGIQGLSENRREITSKPFQVHQSEQARSKGFRERGVAKVTVLGPERPYTIEVIVMIQIGKIKPDLAEVVYKNEHTDKRLANDLLVNILTNLQHRAKTKNVIDDYKAF